MKTCWNGSLLLLCAGAPAFLLSRPLLGGGPEQAPAARPAGDVGRFTLFYTPPFASERMGASPVLYLLDTKTGRVWRHDAKGWESLGSPPEQRP